MNIIRLVRKGRFHTDVYFDFEEAIQSTNNWSAKKEASRILRKIFSVFFLGIFKSRHLPLNIGLSPFRKQEFFCILSGIEYAKMFHYFSFKSKRKVVYMFDPWPSVNEVNKNAIISFQINVAFIPSMQAVNYFNQLRLPFFRAYYLPEAVNSSKYKFDPFEMKNLDILQYGRKWDWLHNEIVEKCNLGKIKYTYPTSNEKLFSTREDLIKALANTKVVVCAPRSITDNSLIQDMETLTTRYFEAMSSKILIWGIAPKELVDLFGYNPIITVDQQDPFTQLCDILENYTSYIPLIEKNYLEVLNNHQWKHRATSMSGILGELPLLLVNE